jgi:hypothetical protein
VGGITDENARTAHLSLNFLQPGKAYVATLYADAKDADYQTNPTAYQIKKGVVTSDSQLNIDLARSGGFALSIMEATPEDLNDLKPLK